MKKFISILFIIASATAVTIIFSWPTFSKYNSLLTEREQKKQILEELQGYLSHLQSIDQQINDNSVQLAKIDQSLLEDNFIPNLFDYLQKNALNYGVRLGAIEMGKISTIKDSKNIAIREINLKIAGPYVSLKNFLIALEKNARIIEVAKMTLSLVSTDTKNPKNVLPSVDLNIKVYSYRK